MYKSQRSFVNYIFLVRCFSQDLITFRGNFKQIFFSLFFLNAMCCFVIATQDYRQADYAYETENIIAGNQQAIYYPTTCPTAYWNPDGTFLGYYYTPYPTATHYEGHNSCPQVYNNNNNCQSNNESELLDSLTEPEPANQQKKNNHYVSSESDLSSVSSSKSNSTGRTNNEESTTSESDSDSDSYLTYSTGMNPLARLESSKNLVASTTDDQEVCDEATTVSVSLPLRFKFSRSENNEEVTTLTVGDSTIRSTDETTVNFTLKKQECHAEEQLFNSDESDSEDENGTNTVVETKLCESIETEFTFKCKRNNDEKTTTTDEDENTTIIEAKPAIVISAEAESKTSESAEESKNNEQDSKKPTKSLLNVENSREETDDEDSGVTSDISRMISEVDTDSECTPAAVRRTTNKYQRTQTHSRLFRLLNDDSSSVFNDNDEKSNNRPSQLAISSSNYSSGLTSPEYSPLQEHPWRRLSCAYELEDQEDSYSRNWKRHSMDFDVLPSLANKVVDKKLPSWAYKINVLCPRIKSTNNVPNATMSPRNDNNDNSLSSSSPNDRCC